MNMADWLVSLVRMYVPVVSFDIDIFDFIFVCFEEMAKFILILIRSVSDCMLVVYCNFLYNYCLIDPARPIKSSSEAKRGLFSSIF